MRTRKRLLCDGRGVSVLVEYILIIGILALLMAFIVPQLNTLMSRIPTANAMKNQFQDVASEISAQLTDMLLVSPKNGVIKSRVYMPSSVGKETYSVKLENGKLVVESNIWTQKVDLGKTTLGFLTKGRTFSSELTHEIVLNSSIHILPTAVAIVYPTEAAVGENVILDMTHSYGEGTLYYRWIIGGYTTEWKVYDPVNPKTGIMTWKFTNPGNYTVKLEVKDSLGYVSSDSVNVNVTSNPKPSLYVNKYVVPSTITPGQSSIDASGSMNEITPLSSTTGNVTSSPAIVKFNINNSNYDYLIFVTTDDFDSFYNEYGIRPISLYVRSPDQNYFVQASDVWSNGSQDGYGYVITNPNTGTWYLAINDLNPRSDESVSVQVYSGYYFFRWFEIYSTVYSASAVAHKTYSSYGINVPEEATKLCVQLIPVQTPTNLYLWLKDNTTGTYYINSTNYWINITNPSA